MVNADWLFFRLAALSDEQSITVGFPGGFFLYPALKNRSPSAAKGGNLRLG